MAKRHYIPITSDVPGVSDSKCAFIRKVIRTALTAEGVDFPCEIDVELTDDETIHEINREMREVDRATTWSSRSSTSPRRRRNTAIQTAASLLIL